MSDHLDMLQYIYLAWNGEASCVLPENSASLTGFGERGDGIDGVESRGEGWWEYLF